MPKNYIVAQHQHVTQKAKPFTIHKNILYKYGHDNQYHRCLQLAKLLVVLYELHTWVVIGHFFANVTTQKILDASY
jgi:hypothetical protein